MTERTDPPLGRLFAPGERLGWRFRDRLRFVRPFPEAPPGPPRISPDLLRRHETAGSSLSRRLVTTVMIWLAGTLLFVCAGACAGFFSPDAATALYVVGALAFLGGIGAVVLVYTHHQRALAALPEARRSGQQWQRRAHEEWQRRRAVFEQAERQRVDGLLEWGAAALPPGSRRLDVVGGTLWGWEAFLTVFGASTLGTRGQLTVLDLSGEAVCAELAELAAAHGSTVDVQRLPSDLVGSDLLAGLEQRQLVDALIEAMHGGEDSRGERSLDGRLLGAICEVIASDLTIDRLVAAVRTVMAEPGAESALTEAERQRLTDLFSDEYWRAAHERLRRIEAHLHPLRKLGARRPEGRSDASLTCVILDSDGRNVRSDLLVDLTAQWLTRRMTTATAGTLVVAGADELPRRHLERLSDICGRRDIRLVYLFRHLREASLQVIGGGAVAFMRLGNHEEATRAADFLGRHHTFVLTQVTRTLGGTQTHGEADTKGRGEKEAVSVGSVLSDVSNPVRSALRHRGVSRQWSTTRTWAQETHWSDAACEQRVYEYTVEPVTLQHLPDYAMLLIESRPDGPIVHPVECNPAVLTLPRATHEPLAELPTTEPSAAAPTDGSIAADRTLG